MKIIFYDTETTGKLHWRHELIQVAGIAYDITPAGFKELEEFEVKMQFDLDKADPEALEMNCYDERVWRRDAISQFEAIKRFDNFASKYRDISRHSKRTGKDYLNARTAAHNLEFDDGFIRAWYKKNDNMFCPFDRAETYCTFERSRWKVNFDQGGMVNKPENYKLETMCTLYGIPLPNAHDALGDVRATALLAWNLMQ